MLETNIWQKVLKGVLYAILLMPLLVWNEFLFPFITTKVLFFRLLVEAAFLIYFVLALKYPEIRPPWSWLTRIVWIYFGIMVVASVFGINFYRSFWSTMERGEGIVTMAHFFLYFTILAAVFKTPKEWFKYLLAVVSSTFFVSLVGIAQIYGLFGELSRSQGARIVGTIGNAAFFAAVMIFGIFLSCFLILRVKRDYPEFRKPVLIYLWVVLLLETIALYHSQTRGAIIAFAGAAVIYAGVAVFNLKNIKWKILVSAMIMGVIVFGILIRTSGNSEFVKNNNTLSRLATISIDDITVQSRFDTWNASIKGLKDRPFLGYGYENFNIAFNKNFPVRIYKDEGSQVWFDRAHNIVFDVSLTSGVVGLVVYLTIFGIALWYLFRLRKKVGWAESGILGIGLLAYFFQNLFVFDTQATYLLFFVVLALIAAQENFYFSEKTVHQNRVSEGMIKNYMIVVVASIVVFAYFANIEPAMANMKIIESIKSSMTGNYLQMRTQFEKGMEYGTYMDAEFRQRYHDMVVQATSDRKLLPEEVKSNYRYLVSELEKNVTEFPKNARHYLYLLSALNYLGQYEPEQIDRVFILGSEALKLSPTRPQIYYELGRAALSRGSYEQSIEYFMKARDLNPVVRKPHVNLLLVAILADQKHLIDEEFDLLNKQKDFSVSEYFQVAAAYRQVGDVQTAIEFLLMAAEKDQNNFLVFLNLAQLYSEKCNIEELKKMIEIISEINPQTAIEGKTFVREAENRCLNNSSE